MHSDVFADTPTFEDLLDIAHEQLMVIRAHPSLEPLPDSPAHRAFDPCVARRLKTFVPLRIVPVRTPGETWQALDAMLQGWRELSRLSKTINLSTWEVGYTLEVLKTWLMILQLVGHLRVWLPRPASRTAYLRSTMQVNQLELTLIPLSELYC
jgi:hypothetical protein